MHRIDSPTSVGGLFVPSIPNTQPATSYNANWANAVQEEIANAVLASGAALSEASQRQLANAISGAVALGKGANNMLNFGTATGTGTAISVPSGIAVGLASVWRYAAFTSATISNDMDNYVYVDDIDDDGVPSHGVESVAIGTAPSFTGDRAYVVHVRRESSVNTISMIAGAVLAGSVNVGVVRVVAPNFGINGASFTRSRVRPDGPGIIDLGERDPDATGKGRFGALYARQVFLRAEESSPPSLQSQGFRRHISQQVNATTGDLLLLAGNTDWIQDGSASIFVRGTVSNRADHTDHIVFNAVFGANRESGTIAETVGSEDVEVWGVAFGPTIEVIVSVNNVYLRVDAGADNVNVSAIVDVVMT